MCRLCNLKLNDIIWINKQPSGYQLFAEANGLEKSHQFLRVRFKTEQYRLLDWADIVELSEDEATLTLSQAIKPILLDILDQQCQLMLRYGRVDARLRPLTHPFIHEESGQVEDAPAGGPETSLTDRFPSTRPLLMKSLNYIQATRRYPARLRWAISDKAKLEEILSKLTTLNNSLDQLLTGQQMQSLHENVTRTNYQIMQMNNRFDHLCELIQADLFLSAGSALASSDIARVNDSRLSNLAKFKCLKYAIDEGSFDQDKRSHLGLEHSVYKTQAIRIASSNIQLVGDKAHADQQRVPAWLTSSIAPWKRVWIEWTSTKTHQFTTRNDAEPLILKRFENLVYLLQEDKLTAQFRALHCHGYYVRSCGQSEIQYGLVFENPTAVDPETIPTSLLDMLHKRTKVPSLSARLALIRALTENVEKLHAVNWLHKGLRSQNILFFKTTEDYAELSEPYLSGFEYSRPETADYLSENPPAIAAEDLYRHPAVQGGPRESRHGLGYKKQHDIYSLGILILEIAYWRPIYDILGYRSAQVIRPSETARVKELLLGGKYVDKVKTCMGDTVADVLRVSLMGPAAFGVVEDDSDIFSAARLQRKFFEVFVQRLQQLRI